MDVQLLVPAHAQRAINRLRKHEDQYISERTVEEIIFCLDNLMQTHLEAIGKSLSPDEYEEWLKGEIIAEQL